MDMLNLMGLFAAVPTVLLITVSFFVMFSLTKVEKSGLRIFGLVVVGLLWIAALIVFSAGLLMVADGFDYFGDHGINKACKCPCYSMKRDCCGMSGYPCRKMMKSPAQEMMIAPQPGIMDPHHGMIMDPHYGMNINSTEQYIKEKYHSGTGVKK